MGHLAPKSVSVAQRVMIRKWVSYQQRADGMWSGEKENSVLRANFICKLINAGVDPGFFLGRCAPLRNVCHLLGGVHPCTNPLDMPLQCMFYAN